MKYSFNYKHFIDLLFFLIMTIFLKKSVFLEIGIDCIKTSQLLFMDFFFLNTSHY